MTDIPWINSFSDNSGSLWDQLRLGGVVWPGLWALKTSKKRELDIVKIRRLDGVRILDNGYFGVALTARGKLWRADQWSEVQRILPDFDPQSPGGGRSPLDQYHPASALLGVGTVYIAEIAIDEPSGGMLPLSIEMVQWFPRPKPFVQGFAGTRRSGAPLNPEDFEVTSPAADTGAKL
jgi:hypothetical protein